MAVSGFPVLERLASRILPTNSTGNNCRTTSMAFKFYNVSVSYNLESPKVRSSREKKDKKKNERVSILILG